MSGWWRRNRVALAITLVLAPLTVGVVFHSEWGGFRDGRPVDPVDAARGVETTFGPADFRVSGMERIRWSSRPGVEQGLPSGTDLVVVRMTVTPRELDAEGASVGCLLQLDEGDGDASVRVWQPTGSAYLDLDLLEGTSTSCDSTLTERYEVAARFLVPVDAGSEADLRLAVQTVDELPRFLRVTL